MVSGQMISLDALPLPHPDDYYSHCIETAGRNQASQAGESVWIARNPSAALGETRYDYYDKGQLRGGIDCLPDGTFQGHSERSKRTFKSVESIELARLSVIVASKRLTVGRALQLFFGSSRETLQQ